MSDIILLSSNKTLENQIKSALQGNGSEIKVRWVDIHSVPENFDFHNEINVFVVEAGHDDVDYRGLNRTLNTLSSQAGISIMVFAGPAGSRPAMDELAPDAVLDTVFDEQDLKTHLEYLVRISELRAMNNNLSHQLSHRVSRLAGLEQQLVHTNKILEALNRCGEIIIKANQEQDMLQQVCDTLASSFDSCLVMVGYAEMDEESSVRIVAKSGLKKEIVDGLKLTWDLSPYGQGPTGTSIRTGKTVFVHHPENDPGTAAWRDLLKEAEVKYILSLPIAHAGVGFGALSIFGGVKVEFSDKELEYLERVAQNIGYGIWFLRHREKRIKVEKELQKANELFSLAMEATEDGLWDWNIETGKTYFSPRWYTMLGYEPNELPMNYESFERIVHPDDLDEVRKKLKEYMEDPKNYSLEFRARAKDGSTRWILARGKIVQSDDQGKPVRLVGTHFDITSRKELEHKLDEARNRAEKANQAKDRFLEAMSHELRTPLNGIMSILQTLTEADLKSGDKEYIQLALDSSRQLLVSINKILELSNLQKGLYCDHAEPFDLTEELTKITSFFLPMARNKNLYLKLEKSDELRKQYLGDISIIRQILWNFLENAIKFTQEGGVVLRVSLQKRQTAGNKSRIAFEVADTGPGLSTSQVDNLFEPFGMAEDSQLKRSSGYGVGLSVCKQLADTIGARIQVRPNSPHGSSFLLILELEPYKQEPAESVQAAEEPDRAVSRQIMVVEDEKVNMMLIERMLTRHGYEVFTAEDGEQALEIMDQHRDLSLILMDIMVPRHDGFELTAMIRNNRFPGLAQVPIVAVTALADGESKQKCFDAGMNAYLAKPIDNQELMSTVDTYMKN